MNVGEAVPAGGAACTDCLRRSWLLAELGGPLDCNCRADGRLFDLLELADRELIGALAGRRSGELDERHGASSPASWHVLAASSRSAGTTPATRGHCAPPGCREWCSCAAGCSA